MKGLTFMTKSLSFMQHLYEMISYITYKFPHQDHLLLAGWQSSFFVFAYNTQRWLWSKGETPVQIYSLYL